MSITENRNSRTAKILTLLTNELELQEKHLHLLRRQKTALIACDREEFGRLQSQYEDLLTELELQDSDRKRCFPSGVRLKSEVDDWPAQDRSRAEETVMRLRDLVREIGKQGRQNKVLISNDLKLINFQLKMFMTAVNRGFQYVSSGASVPVQATRLINRVA